jgi:hypothetical protein
VCGLPDGVRMSSESSRGWGWLLIGCTLTFACSSGTGSDVEVSEASPVDTSDEASATGVESPLQVENALTLAQSKTALKLIDDICGDTWCSGDYNFGFRLLRCNRAARSCTLTLQVFPREGVASKHPSYWRSCKTHGFHGFASLVNTSASGYQSLTEDYYDALTECTSRVVSSIQ